MSRVFIDSRQKQLERSVGEENEILVGAIEALEATVSDLTSTLALVGIAIVQSGEAHPSKFDKKDSDSPLKMESKEVLDALEGVAKIGPHDTSAFNDDDDDDDDDD